MKLSSVSTIAGLIATASASELCQDSSAYDSSATVSQFCYIDTYADLDAATTACEVSDRYCNAFEQSSKFYCMCSTYDLTVDCPLTDPTYAAQSTCADSDYLWDYSTSDAETTCSYYPGDMAQWAYNCCGGGYSICEDYTSQLCSSTNDYTPTVDYSNWCYGINDATDDAVASTDCSDLGCYWGSADLTGDGVVDNYCWCSDFDTATGCPLTDYDAASYSNCAASWEDWDYNSEYTSVTAACQANYNEYATAANTCCASQTSVCAGYCYSADSTVAVMYGEVATEVPLSEVKKGDKIMTFHAEKNTKSYSTVTYIANAKSEGDFYEINMMDKDANSAEKIRATPHHTFPSCANSDKLVQAAHIKEGDCLVTSTGKKHVASVKKQASVEGDYTYSLQVEDSDVVFVGGVATHSQSIHQTNQKHSVVHANALAAGLKLRGSANVHPSKTQHLSKKYMSEELLASKREKAQKKMSTPEWAKKYNNDKKIIQAQHLLAKHNK